MISYDFSAIEADVLGNIYEQYLGHILKKTRSRATLTESQTRRKGHGIFYTPTSVVSFIVRNTLGKLLEDNKNKLNSVQQIRVLDPACGSGSFLIKSFDGLNEYYAKHDKNYSQTQLETTLENATYTRKLHVLLDHIYSVDLDKQAIEIAQLNLLLKVPERGLRLPLLQQNIKQGNSLIDYSFVYEDKAFNWNEEFPNIIKDGGFDIIIGNPPYIRAQNSFR
jgi:type I restriction-modification system DNA methylase subunit